MSNLNNLGKDRGFVHGAPRRLIFCLTHDDSGAENKISIAEAAAIASWIAKFDVPGFSVDPSGKFVVSPLIRQFGKEDTDKTEWTVEDYKRTMRKADADLKYSLLDPDPAVLGKFAEFEDEDISVYILSDDTKVIGIIDGDNLVPLPIKRNSFSAPNWSPGGYEEGSTNVFTFRLNSASDLNRVGAVTIADADVTSDTDFFSLEDGSGVVTSPATTGCQIALSLDGVDPDEPGVSIPITGVVFGEINVIQADTSETGLAGAGSLTVSGGTLTINEADIFQAGTNYVEISKSGYDIARITVEV